MKPLLIIALFGTLLAGPVVAQTESSAAGENLPARIQRLEAEERQLRRDGDPAHAVVVLRELVDALEGSPRQGSFLLSLYITERDSGNFEAAARLHKKILETPRLHDGVRLGLFFRDAQYRAWIGDAAGARSLWQQGSAVVASLSPNDRIAQRLKHRFLSRQAAAEATLLRMEGDLEGAARAMQLALAENDADRRRFAGRSSEAMASPAEERDLATIETDRAILTSELIGMHVQSGHLGKAELVALDWLAVSRQPDSGQRVHGLFARKRFGDVMLAAGRCQKALDAFDGVIADYRAQQRNELSSNLIFARRSRVQALMCLDRWEQALEGFRELERETKGKTAREILRAGIDRALVRAMTGNLKAAEDMIDAAVASLMKSYGPDHADTITANGIRALILSRRGRDAEALPLFRRYVETRIAAGGDGPQDGEETAHVRLRKRLILEAYLATLSRQTADTDTLTTAFQVADALRAGRVQQAIAASAVRAGISNTGLAELVRKEQNQSAELAGLYRALGEQNVEGGVKMAASELPDLRPRIDALEKQRKETLDGIRRQFPEYFRLVRPAPPTPAEVGELLADGEVMVSIYTAAEASYVFAVTRSTGAKEARNVTLHVAPLGTRAAGEAVRQLRTALDVGDVPLERLPLFDLSLAHQLFTQLLEPLRPQWGEAKQLIISASGALGQLPFSLLVERPETLARRPLPFAGYADIPWLISARAISHVPSAAAFVALRRLPAASGARANFIGYGDPDFGAAQKAPGKLRSAPRRGTQAGEDNTGKSLRAAYATLPPLPDTREEVLALAKALKAKPEDAVLGKAASRNNVLQSDLSRSAVLAFATHGLQPGELPGLDEPALAMTLLPGEEQSPLLTLSDVLGLKLDADWVLLSACNTAGADGEAAEALSGLGRGFFFAGARAVLVTHWPVESSSARQLVSALFAQSTKAGSRAEALRQAQLALMRQSAGTAFSYAHPLFWAPFALVGDGGGRQ